MLNKEEYLKLCLMGRSLSAVEFDFFHTESIQLPLARSSKRPACNQPKDLRSTMSLAPVGYTRDTKSAFYLAAIAGLSLGDSSKTSILISNLLSIDPARFDGRVPLARL
jgi:hypothetical protein